MTFYNAGIPSGTYQLVITFVGALIGIICGIIIGRFGVYSKMNKTNNFSSDDEFANQNMPKQSAGGMLGASIFFFLFAGLGGYGAYQSYIQQSQATFAIMICAVMFGGAGIIMVVSAIKAFRNKSE